MKELMYFNKKSKAMFALFAMVAFCLAIAGLNPYVNIFILGVSSVLTIAGVTWSEERKKLT